ncbi:PAS domain-containing sensor histidine kinase [Halodesulfurarchaeum formicicum]|uniref:PAS domain-containing sensor histidine kinase n=1 Tax=Halodesulfurarchaeum formicicum TaxID=1873524 RepID=UPI0009040E24|nr:sensor histidine kinase [Halodesulfurarchaeum formicicum]
MDAAVEGSYQTYFEKSPVAVFVVDEDGTYLEVNPAACELVGCSESELLSKNVSDLSTSGESTPPSFQHVRETGRVQTELQIQHSEGHLIDVLLDAVSLGDGTFVGYVRDITDRKEREREVESLKERLELAVDAANLGVWDWDLETDTVQFNDQWATMLGYSASEIDSALDAWKSRVHPADRELVMEAVDAHLAGETAYIDTEHRLQTADGGWKWVRDIGHITERGANGDPKRAVGIHQDIDERKRAEQELEAAHDRLRQVIDLVPDLIFVKNRAGEYLLVNDAVCEAYGRPAEEIIGRTDQELLFTEEHPKAFREDDLAVIESGEPKTIPEEDLVTADGETRVFHTTKIPYEPSGSDDDAVLGYARDITELKAYERQIETQRDNLEVLNQIVRHDIRNDLQLVLAYADLLHDSVEESASGHLHTLQNAAQDAVAITRTARDVTEVLLQSGADRAPTRLRPVLEGAIDSARSNHEHAAIQVEGSIPEVSVLVDDLLESVFRNLLQNAVIHNDQELPEVTVTTTAGKETVAVSIADNGPGVPDEQKAEIFEEGVQGLDSEGTGLGLYLVETLIDRYGGSVQVEDNEPRGAVFTVELPLA